MSEHEIIIPENPNTIEGNADHIIKTYSEHFAKDVIKSKFPNAIDGLLLVHRRSIWMSRGEGGRPVVRKSLRTVGEITNMHPHGDGSIYSTIARMSRDFEYNPPLFKLIGNVGTYSGDRPAPPRYTEMSISDFAYDTCFRGVDVAAIHKTIGEDLTEYEPVNFVPSIPYALLYGVDSIGYGFGSLTAPHNLVDVCDIAISFIHQHMNNPLKPFDYASIAEKFIPDFPIRNTITNALQLTAAYKAGEFNAVVCIDGDVELSENIIRIFTIPYGNPFNQVVLKLQELTGVKNSWADKSIIDIKDSSGDNAALGEVVIVLKRNVNVFEAWENIRKIITFSNTLRPRPNYTDGNYIYDLSPINVLRQWYTARTNILVSSKKHQLASLSQDLRIADAYLIICDHRDDVIDIIKNNTIAKGIELLMSKYALTEWQANYLIKAPLHILSTTSKDEHVVKYKKLAERIAELKLSFGYIPSEMIAELEVIKKKYGSPRRTTIPKYIGYIAIGGGCVQFQDTSEIPDIINAFPKSDMSIYMYDGPYLHRITNNNKFDTSYIPKYTTGDIFGLKSIDSGTVTVNIVDGVACCVRGVVAGSRDAGYCYTTPQSFVIRKNGKIDVVNITEEISLRKSICRGANTDVIHVYPYTKKDHFVIAFNTDMPNNIMVRRIKNGVTCHISISPTGESEFVHSYRSKDVFVNFPEKFLNRNSTKVIHLRDLEVLLDGNDFVRIDIGMSKWKNHKLIDLY